jgi:heme A synthase
VSTSRKVYSVLGVLLLVELALQFYFIAGAALNISGADKTDTAQSVFAGFKVSDNWGNLHAFNGTLVVPVTILVLIAMSFAARLPGNLKWQTAALFGLMVIQASLGGAGAAGGAWMFIGGLHGVNALLIAGLTFSLAWRTWAFGERARKFAYPPQPAIAAPAEAAP